MAHSINEQCKGCGLCAKVCPVSAITGEIKGMHVINEKRCVDCGVCGRVCGLGAVIDAKGNPVAKVPRKEWKQPVIDSVICSGCSICVDACGKQALGISYPAHPGDIALFATLCDVKACVGCEICAVECPLGAIRMEVPA